jgi:hypothetical protein
VFKSVGFVVEKGEFAPSPLELFWSDQSLDLEGLGQPVQGSFFLIIIADGIPPQGSKHWYQCFASAFLT